MTQATVHTYTETACCAVCADQADGYHYGVLSCRGCNAFFRRAVTYNLQFKCRKNGNCVIDRTARCACRACRLNKCKLVGMDRAAVQIKRGTNGIELILPSTSTALDVQLSKGVNTPPITLSGICELVRASQGGKTLQNFPLASSKSPPNSSSHAPDSPFLSALALLAFTNLETGSPGNKSAPTHGAPKLIPPLGGGTTLVYGSGAVLASQTPALRVYLLLNDGDSSLGFLARLVEDYFDQRRRRRAMLSSSVEEVLNESVEETFRLRGPANLETFTRTYRVQMTLMFEWVERLAEFQQLDLHDKAKLLRAFAANVEMGFTDRLLFVDNSFAQPTYIPLPGTTLDSQRAVEILHGEGCLRIIKELLHPLVKMGISFGELLALRLIVLWNPQHSLGLSAYACDIIQKASERTLQELHSWYAENQFDELKQRLSNLLLLLSPLMKYSSQLNELTTLIPDYSVSEWNSLIDDLLR